MISRWIFPSSTTHTHIHIYLAKISRMIIPCLLSNGSRFNADKSNNDPGWGGKHYLHKIIEWKMAIFGQIKSRRIQGSVSGSRIGNLIELVLSRISFKTHAHRFVRSSNFDDFDDIEQRDSSKILISNITAALRKFPFQKRPNSPLRRRWRRHRDSTPSTKSSTTIIESKL